ncbi:hypothetical protein [Arenibaculum pallidiluteum]|uniref:hypothetical protein n=1 Tax=Arenibaculum pallidiluteum TaxID=2812559 RepID=UPI001A97075F|nr:hypothetical protein [Arenibaculum pallidiluteum]
MEPRRSGRGDWLASVPAAWSAMGLAALITFPAVALWAPPVTVALLALGSGRRTLDHPEVSH